MGDTMTTANQIRYDRMKELALSQLVHNCHIIQQLHLMNCMTKEQVAVNMQSAQHLYNTCIKHTDILIAAREM